MAKDSSQPLDQWFIGIVKKVDAAMETVAEEVAEEGQEQVLRAIETRGTGRVWKRTYYKRGGGPRSASKPGRVWTGDMRGDVDLDVSKFNRNTIMARFGWIHNYKEYYGLQEGGFVHDITGEVEGMNAMADAADNIMKFASDRIGSELKRV